MSADGRDDEAASTVAEQRQPSRLTALGVIGGWLRSIRTNQPDADSRAAISELLPNRAEASDYLVRFAALTALSAAIAAFGLLADSGAVVIGAMLVAPLMTPIVGAAAATVMAHNRRLFSALAIISLGVVVAVAVGWVVSFIAGERVIDVEALPVEIRSRTFPGLLDLGIAISAGAAAGYIQPRRSAFSAMPGVGIAVALVPPLATVGITAQLGLVGESRNAMLLFLTNLAAIVFAAGIMLLLSGFRPRADQSAGAVRIRLAATLAIVIVIAVPLTIHTRSVLADARLSRAVVRAVEDWDDQARLVEHQSDLSDGTARVELLVTSEGIPAPAWQLAGLIRDYAEVPVELRLRYQRNEVVEVVVR